MGDLEQLKHVFAESWDWSSSGEEWSTWWGGTPALWFGAILPRIHAFIPTGTILELAPGFGRVTQYLKEACDRLVIVDLSEKCIDHCRDRFASSRHIEYHVNDGRSLEMIPDNSVDFAFSWDSLVHADLDILDDYIAQMDRILTADGVGFLHHSNARRNARSHALAMRAPIRLQRPLIARGLLLDVYAWRSPTVNADDVALACEGHNLACVTQELFNWEHGYYRTDAISVFTKRGSVWDRPRRVIRSSSFARDARRMRNLYARTGFSA